MKNPLLPENQSSSIAANDVTSRTWSEWYNHRTWGEWFKASVLDYRQSGINGIASFAVMNAAYNTYNHFEDNQPSSSIFAPALWALALTPQVYNRFWPLKSVDAINQWTTVMASFAVYSMVTSLKTYDVVAAGSFLTHVLTPEHLSNLTGQHLSLKTMQSLEGLGLVVAGICIFKGSPAMSFDSLSKFLDGFLPQNLGICVGVFGASRFIAPFYDKSEEDNCSEQSSVLGNVV
ncbi:MAG: hypothetical protein CMF55_05320 [Legionellales bacterium]|nr:hypothetical protein [Legionellales bacterium]HAG62088.1 hypothetical protein [Coxiellaceae bacterium]